MTDQIAALRDALTAALPDLTDEQVRQARNLLIALTPPMEEPKWPGAVVMAKCSTGASAHTLHVRVPGGGTFRWKCVNGIFRWEELTDHRPLTPEERAEHGIPSECEPITNELVERCIEAADFFTQPRWVRTILRAAGHQEEVQE